MFHCESLDECNARHDDLVRLFADNTDARRLAAVMRAFVSRPERFAIKRTVTDKGRIGYLLTLNGTILIDGDHARAFEEATK